MFKKVFQVVKSAIADIKARFAKREYIHNNIQELIQVAMGDDTFSSTEGIFRRTGSKRRASETVKEIAVNKQSYDYVKLLNSASKPVVTSVLKGMLRMLGPLLMSDTLLEIAAGARSPNTILKTNLSNRDYTTLLALLRLLQQVADHDNNKMDTMSVAKCIAGSICETNATGLDILTEDAYKPHMVAYLIDNLLTCPESSSRVRRASCPF